MTEKERITSQFGPQGPDGQAVPQPQENPAAEFEFAHPADGAELLESLPLEEQVEVITTLEPEDAAEFIAEMERHDRARLMKDLPPDYAADLLGQMSPDDAADILDDLDDAHQQRLLQRVEQEEALEIETLLTFDPDTAGGVMNTEVTVLDQNLTADQAIQLIRSAAEESEIPYYAYIVDEADHLIGVLSLRNLMLSRPGQRLRDVLGKQHLVYSYFDVDKEEVAQKLTHYNFLALPIVDREMRLLGVVTHDDVIDIIHEEASEDMLGMVGAGQDETTDTPWLQSVRMRLPWLLVNVLNSAVSAWVVHLFEGTITQMAILAALMPIVANQAGNSGQQSLAVIIRQLAMEAFDRKRAWLAVAREARIGLLNGIIVGILVMVGVSLLTHKIELAFVMSLALGVDMCIGNVAGASIPVVFKELGRDPAQASSIFLTALTDSAGFLTFLGLSSLLLF
ncbi:magnesium transporter [Desulfobaculum xiamenense]|uniref:Magnesium transporter MgtE n=1 Tax=Desulfobaculum xiamenense TaxID=995050 RepID=A0A846QDR1_9BACT|nr:magnesium transporter [Desulfobaculum xiamenense]NJB66866.1 magnesium transporter [Desulfobaculum xiamenense]